MKNLTQMTAASQTDACTTGAQNIEASEKMTASSGRVTRADSSLRANIASSSYSNSGLMLDPCDRRARMSRNCAWATRAGILGAGRLRTDSGSAGASAVRIASC